MFRSNQFDNMVLSKVRVIDGGFATQLTVHVGKSIDGDPLWSARFNATNPDAVIKTHLDFLEAGAEVIITNTYQASVDGYNEHLNCTDEQSIKLIKDTVKLAHVARSMHLKSRNTVIPWIVGSIGPYGAHLHDGSEYNGSYADRVSKDTIKDWHRTRIDAVLSSGVDALAIETIPCLMEAESLVELLCDEYPLAKYWISFQCKDGTNTARGEKFSEAATRLWNMIKERNALNNLVAIGVNCLHPRFITPLFKSLNGNLTLDKRIPLVAYPNSGEVYNVENGWSGKEDCKPIESYVPEWIELGAKFVGGCCRTYARDISRIKTAVKTFCCEDE
ncbi:Homocysteine S-methyltransferase 3 [Pseudolycoriella hygida]|uniref:Homocysteine S-methyltransferase 3 n=1 Tax=Pseudolycoriella hygida TaxID=35572 RepID=A0A9Q0NAK6_9DIPT|nr:Homocysteine S-methyltransferase 3 [Pseudolycoriella hygida]